MAESAKQIAYELRRLKFIERHANRMRKKNIFTWVSGEFELPLWIIDYIKDGQRIGNKEIQTRIVKLIRAALEMNPNKRNVTEWDTGIVVLKIGGKLARDIEAWRKAKRTSLKNAVRDLVYWGVNL